MKTLQSTFSLLAGYCAWLLSASGVVQATPPVIPEGVKTTVRQRVDYGCSAGIVVGLMNTSGATFFNYGNTDLEGGSAVDEDTVFEIGSVTKVFTTVLLADMAEQESNHE